MNLNIIYKRYLKDYANKIIAKLYAENWDGTYSNAISILKNTVHPYFCINFYNKYKKEINNITKSQKINKL